MNRVDSTNGVHGLFLAGLDHDRIAPTPRKPFPSGMFSGSSTRRNTDIDLGASVAG